MENIKNLEIIQINTVNGKLVATASYQDTNNVCDLNHGYNTVDIPINIRKFKISPRGNILVNQSIDEIDNDFVGSYV